MIVTCPNCDKEFDDLFRTWVCPHPTFEASPDAINALKKRGLVKADLQLPELQMQTPEGELVEDDDKNKEIQHGLKLAVDLINHLRRMGAKSLNLPLLVQAPGGLPEKYLVRINLVEDANSES